jgi:GH43 family beta-xylosidase
MSGKPVLLWHVYYVHNCRYTTPRKHKYVVPVCKNADADNVYMGFLINSQMTDFAKKNPELKDCHAFIDTVITRQYGLDHNSFLSCANLYEFPQKELTIYKFPLLETTKKIALRTIHRCTLIDRIYQRVILEEAGETPP